MKAHCILLTLAVVLLGPSTSAQWVWTDGQCCGNICVLATMGTHLFAGTDSGGYVSTNNGTSWTRLTLNWRPSSSVACFAVIGPNLFAGTTSCLRGDFGIFLSTNNGTSWTAVNNGLPRSRFDTTQYVTVPCLTSSGANLFAGTGDDGIFLSTNNGTSWTAVNNGLPRNSIDSRNYDNVHCLATDGTNTFAGIGTAGFFLSTNNGASWSEKNEGLPKFGGEGGFIKPIYALAVSGMKVFAGSSQDGVFLSTDSGTSWTPVNTGLPTNSGVGAFAVSGTNLFAVSGGSIFLSTNNGTDWTPVNTGLPTNPEVGALAVSGTNIFAGTHSGVWRRPLSEMITSVEPPGRELPREFLLQQNCPNPFNPSTTIEYELPKSSDVKLSVYDILGREVTVLVNERRNAGVHEVKFDGSNHASGVYFYRLQAGDFVATKRLLLLK